MDETTTSLSVKVKFRIIPFDDALWKAVFPQLKEQLGIEQINIVESKLYLSPFKHYYDVYVDKALIWYGSSKRNGERKNQRTNRQRNETRFRFFERYGGTTMELIVFLKNGDTLKFENVSNVRFSTNFFKVLCFD